MCIYVYVKIDAHWCTHDLRNLVGGLPIAFNPGVSVDRDFVAIIVSAGSSDWDPPSGGNFKNKRLQLL